MFVINCIYDELTDNIKNIFEKFKNLNTDMLDIEVLYRWNTGGTIKSMEKTLEFVIDNNITSNYIGIFEDDSFFNKEYIFDTIDLLFEKNIDIVGCQVKEGRPDISYENGYKVFKKEYWDNKLNSRQCPWIKEKHIYLNNSGENLIHDKNIKWIDGAVYITTIDKLVEIKKKLHKLTLAPENKQYTHIEHGINYGEVGFPTRLFINGFKFYGLKHNGEEKDYYKYIVQNSIGVKTI